MLAAAFSFVFELGFVGAQQQQHQFDYELALKQSILFYEAQRSGKLVNNRIPWRGDSFLDDAQGIDLSGGYFDGNINKRHKIIKCIDDYLCTKAGDSMKYGFPLGHTIIFLAWSLIDYKDGYVAAGEYENALAGVRWGSDWILKVFKSFICFTYI